MVNEAGCNRSEEQLETAQRDDQEHISEVKKCLVAAETKLSISKQQLQCEVNRYRQEEETYWDKSCYTRRKGSDTTVGVY